MPMNKKLSLLNIGIRLVHIVLILVFVKLLNKIRGCDKMKELIKKKVLAKNWTFNEISDLANTIQFLSEEVWSEMTILERIDLVRDVRINETLVGWDFEHAIREVVLTSLKGEIAEIIKNMLSNATINFGGNNNEISEGSLGGESHKERPTNEKKSRLIEE
jgi:hypothetical protein